LRRSIPVLLAFLGALGTFVVFVQPAKPEPSTVGGIRELQRYDPEVLRQIDRYRKRTWHWQRLMGRKRSPYVNSVRSNPNPDYHVWVRDLWKVRLSKTRRLAARPPHRRAWLCIHRYEGRWNDPNAPYYGGLQMDLSFQRRYGRWLLRVKGTADNWTPLEQMWVAERAYRSGRGFYPWPNTARYCGLI
jgi:hypothetical protein